MQIDTDAGNIANLKQVGHSLYLLGKHKAALDVYKEAQEMQVDEKVLSLSLSRRGRRREKRKESLESNATSKARAKIGSTPLVLVCLFVCICPCLYLFVLCWGLCVWTRATVGLIDGVCVWNEHERGRVSFCPRTLLSRFF